jgi:hypothetical protein
MAALAAATMTNPELLIRLGTSGDAIDVDFPVIAATVGSRFAIAARTRAGQTIS